MTFQELTDDIGSAAIYSGTNVDEATQTALLEWMFDRYLSMEGNDTTTWLRRYRRNLNMFYPMYLDYVQIEVSRSNLDPFISIAINRTHEDQGETTNTGSNSKTGTTTNTGSLIGVVNTENVRTPDLETAQESDATRTDNTLSTVSAENTRTNNLNKLTVGSNVRTDNLANGSTTSNSDTSTTVHDLDVTDITQNRTVNIIYPEANMGAIPTTGVHGFPSSIDYAESEVDAFGEATHREDGQDDVTRTGQTTVSGTNTGTVDTAVREETDDTGTVRDVASDQTSNTGTVRNQGDITTTETGTETTTTETRTNNGTTNNTSVQEAGTNSNTINDERSGSDSETGRRETKAELMKQAINCIISTNSIKWLVNSLQLCFDNYSEI